jgi:D-glycero-alpha-D-manno-heptose-7-phosphate kinase
VIISRTPLRVSFFGGGTDLASYYEARPGAVISTSIDKYLYVMARRQIGIVEHRFRVNWREVEFCDEIDEIKHPIVREALRMLEIDFPLEISTFSDIPSNSGLGSSSAFAVGLLHALYGLKGQMQTKSTLAYEAARIEIDVLDRTMGLQDHFASAYGGLNVLRFDSGGLVSVEPVFYRRDCLERLVENLMMFWIGQERDASAVLESQAATTPSKLDVLTEMCDFVPQMRSIVESGGDLDEIGPMLHQSWMLKKSLTDDVSNRLIDRYYEVGIKAGARGGKLCGAGGGGFLLLYVKPDDRVAVSRALVDTYPLSWALDSGGTRITYYEPSHVY